MNGIIVAAAYGYGIDQLHRFVHSSMRKTDASLVLLVREPVDATLHTLVSANRRIMLDTMLTPISTSSGTNQLSPALIRYLHAADHLRSRQDLSDDPINMVLICDSRDVFFQSNPFISMETSGDSLLVAAEPESIGNCPINRSWICALYPESYEALAPLKIICSGTTIGRHKTVLEYLQTMEDEILKFQKRDKEIPHGGDQGIHNYLIHTNKLPKSKIVGNETSLFITCHHQKSFTFDRRGRLLNKNGDVCPIVHQYDRVAPLFSGAFFNACFN